MIASQYSNNTLDKSAKKQNTKSFINRMATDIDRRQSVEKVIKKVIDMKKPKMGVDQTKSMTERLYTKESAVDSSVSTFKPRQTISYTP